MEHTIDVPTFERALVSYASPTLAGIKPAALFTFAGTFDGDGAEPHTRARIEQRRRALLAVIDSCASALRQAGICIRVLVWRKCGALVYVYRPQELARELNAPAARPVLDREGYDTANPSACIERLALRIAAASKSSRATCALGRDRACEAQESCPCAFPHEVGFFLGYPAEDVLGFIEHEGRDYLAVGVWKVYAHLDRALATFEGYRLCTERTRRRYARGSSLKELALKR